jgi:hypothetical protein
MHAQESTPHPRPPLRNERPSWPSAARWAGESRRRFSARGSTARGGRRRVAGVQFDTESAPGTPAPAAGMLYMMVALFCCRPVAPRRRGGLYHPANSPLPRPAPKQRQPHVFSASAPNAAAVFKSVPHNRRHCPAMAPKLGPHRLLHIRLDEQAVVQRLHLRATAANQHGVRLVVVRGSRITCHSWLRGSRITCHSWLHARAA